MIGNKINQAIELIRPYYESELAGGNLHVSLDDGNMEDGNVWFCLEEAVKERDLDGAKIAVFLLTMTEDERFDLYDRYDEYAR